MGEKLQQLVDRSMVQTVADMYDLTPDQLGKLQRMGKRAQKLVDAIAQSKPNPGHGCCMDWAFVMSVVNNRLQRFPTVEHLAEAEPTVTRLFMASAQIAHLYTSGSALLIKADFTAQQLAQLASDVGHSCTLR